VGTTDRVKIVINDTIIEQVTEFKYLGYCISDCKSDLEDKLQTYNKINGTIWRNFGKHMTNETKLRIHNITAKATLKFESEVWVLKKRDEQCLETAQMKFLRHLLGITKLEKVKNQIIRKKLGTEHGKGNKTVPAKVATTKIDYRNRYCIIDRKDEGT
jgi:predicted SPOUT superfamily RNA methylase MTH1